MTDREIFVDLFKQASSLVLPYTTGNNVHVGDKGCALYARNGTIFRGVSVNVNNMNTFSAECNALFSMLSRDIIKFTHIVVLGEDDVLEVPGSMFMNTVKQLMPYSWRHVKLLTKYPEVEFRNLGDIK